MWWRNYSQTLFLKIKIEHISVVCQVEGFRNLLERSCKPLAFTSYKAFLRNKRRSGTSLLDSFPHFPHFPYYVLLTGQISMCDFLGFLRYWAICVL